MDRACRLTCLASLLLAGCAAGPDYKRPELRTPPSYLEQPAPAAAAAAGTDLRADWWTLFGSKPLDELVAAALLHNPGVAQAQAALRSAQESVRAQQAAYFPSVQAGYQGTRQKIAGTLASPASSAADIYSLHTLQVSVAYAPDVFGANRRAVESLQAQAEGQRWAAEATYLTLTSNVVLAAVQEAGLRDQIAALRRQRDIQRDLLERYRRLLELGQVAELDVAQQAAALAAVEAQLPPLDKALAQQRDALKALVGQLPADPLPATFRLDDLRFPREIPRTLPSTLVDHRPDVLAAEAQLRTTSAAIGIAAAARLPSISLGVDGWGSAAYQLGKLLTAGTGFWGLSAGLTQPVFDAGALAHREASARAACEAAAAQYRQIVIGAFQNVADALQALDADADGLGAARRSQEAADRSLAIARRQFELGDLSTLAVLQTEQAALQAALGVAQARAAQLSDLVALVQALGGGWWNRAPQQASSRVSN